MSPGRPSPPALATATRRVRRRHAGFTLIELVVVIVVIAIAAAAIAPRMTRDDSRKAEASASAVREVLSAAATRAEPRSGNESTLATA